MAKQKGIIKLAGTIEDISFYKSQDGYLARARGGIEKERIMNDPAFQRVRENASEFGRAGAASRLIRAAFKPVLQQIADRRMTSRLTRLMLKVVKSDPVSARGERIAAQGQLSMLKGFEFNVQQPLHSAVSVPYPVTIDRAAGSVTISIPSFVPNQMIEMPEGASHCKMICACAELDYNLGEFNMESTQTPDMETGSQTEEAIELSVGFPVGSTNPLLVVFGVDFSQEVNGNLYPITNGAYNALSIIEVDMAA